MISCRFCNLLGLRTNIGIGLHNMNTKGIIRSLTNINASLNDADASSSTITNIDAVSDNSLRLRKILRVGIVGTPNAGKSTFVNTAVGSKVSIVTKIRNTTRANAYGVCTNGNTQIVFIDSPGIIPYQESRRLRMSQSHIRAPRRLKYECDMLCLIVDAENSPGNRRKLHTIEGHVLQLLREAADIDVPSIMVLNKIDTLKNKEVLLKLVASLTNETLEGYDNFKSVFMVSALTGDGVSNVVEYFTQHAKQGKWIYAEDVNIDSNVEEQISEAFREKLLLLFQHEIPWQVKQVTCILEKHPDGTMKIHQKLFWPKKSQQKYVMTKLHDVYCAVLEDLEEMFQCSILLTIDVDVNKNLTRDTVLTTW